MTEETSFKLYSLYLKLTEFLYVQDIPCTNKYGNTDMPILARTALYNCLCAYIAPSR